MNILLVADLGSKDNYAYHVGDEAMFYETYLWYRKNKPKYNISIFSNNRSHNDLKVNEYIIPELIKNRGLFYFLSLIIKSIGFKQFGINKLSLVEKEFLEFIAMQDIIHFTGGGNISSIFKATLFFYSFIIFFNWINRKKIILTSQTIGPFKIADFFLVALIFNLPYLIGIREKYNVNKSLNRYLIYLPKIYSMIDSAYTLSSESDLHLQSKKKEVVRIGLSIHKWGQYTRIIEGALLETIEVLASKYKIEIILIPHVITDNRSKDDTFNMKQILSKLNKRISIISLNNEDIVATKTEPAINIKYLTKNVDLLITTRYHGIIFALSSNTPCITFKMDKYYNQKNIGALNHLYGIDIGKYVVDLQNGNSELKNKIEYLISNFKQEKKYLEKKNLLVSSKIDILRKKLFF